MANLAGHHDDPYALIRAIARQHPTKPSIGEAAVVNEDVARFTQPASLAFARSTAEVVSQQAGTTVVAVQFMGLLGPNGPLPLHLTDRVHRDDDDDSALLPFLNVLQDRLIALFFRAWQQAAPGYAADQDDDSLQHRYASMAGVLGRVDAGACPSGPSTTARAHFARLLSRGTGSSEVLRAVLAEDLGVDVQVRPFAGGWLSIDCSAQASLGMAQLGRSGVLGSRVWDPAGSFRIRVGPVKREQLIGLLPGGSLHERIQAWVRLLGGSHLTWSLQVVLAPDAFEPASLGGSCSLGHNCWVGATLPDRELDDLIVDGTSTHF
ncbi:MAG: type VI secretion system baseplate subunit TssG [Phycisphaera sp.]|nr:MAG: type VI secretion system baseplate subunit TssG [Phycisphaera sp.]